MMRTITAVLLLASVAFAQTGSPRLPDKDVVRIREFYRLADQIGEQVWPGWNRTPAPLLLVTNNTEFLTRYAEPPNEFTKLSDGFYSRPRQFSTNLLATFPPFGPQSVIVIGEAENTDAKTSTPWLITLMHEHFHQMQDGHPGTSEAVNGLGLARGDKTGMWMLNYPFPYDKPEVVRSFAHLRDLLLGALSEPDGKEFDESVRQYAAERQKVFAQLAPDDRKYLNFQIWKEGIARYAQIKAAEAAEHYEVTPECKALADYESFEAYAAKARNETLSELKQVDLSKSKRVAVYSFGACEGLLLDRINPKWKDRYFGNLFTLDPYFEHGR